MGTVNFRDYRGVLNGKAAVICYEPCVYSDEEDEAYLREWCGETGEEYESLCPCCRERILSERGELEFEAAYESVEWEARRVLEETFGDSYRCGPVSFKAESGYYGGCQWLFDEEGFESCIEADLRGRIESLCQDAGVDDESLAADLAGTDSIEEYGKVRGWHVGWYARNRDIYGEEADTVAGLLDEKFGRLLLSLRESCESEWAGKADRAVREIARNTGMKIAYRCSGWEGPKYIEP